MSAIPHTFTDVTDAQISELEGLLETRRGRVAATPEAIVTTAHKGLLEGLTYDASTGEFRCRTAVGPLRAGAVAGSTNANGYRYITIGGRKYLAHRLAWLHENGAWPPNDIDHVNGNRADNRIANLRLASRSQNNANRRTNRNSQSGLKGAVFHKRLQKWCARIMIDRKDVFLGHFPTPEAAHEAYRVAAIAAFGEFARSN
jgi:hypothetical protein